MARIVTSTLADATMMAYGEPSEETKSFLERQWSSVTEYTSNAARDVARRSREAFDRVYSSSGMRRARALLRRTSSLFDRDEIRELTSLLDIQTAKPAMRRWVMANPRTRRRYQEQRTFGYGEDYVDVEPGRIGEDHYDYRRVMDGIAIDREQVLNGETFMGYEAVTYVEELKEGDRDLDIMEQVIIRSVWRLTDSLFAEEGDDPLSIYGDKL